MGRVLWLLGAGVLALTFLVAFRNEAVASDRTTCTQVDGFLSFCLNVPASTIRRETSVPLVILPSDRADVLVEVGIPGSDAAAVAAGMDRSVERVETLFGRSFSARPRILLFGSNASFAQGAAELFGYADDTAAYVARTYGGIFDRPTTTIAINWSSVGHARANAAIEHELTHLMIRQIARGNDVPVWFDEGIATLVDGAMPAVTTPSLTFRELTSLSDFHRSYERVGDLAYEFSGAAVRAIEAKAGWSGVLALLSVVGDGSAFETALVQVGGVDVSRLESIARMPGITVQPVDATGNVLWTLASTTPNAELQVRIAGGRSYSLTFTVTTDALGMYRGSFGSTAAPGLYTVSVAGSVATFSTVR